MKLLKKLLPIASVASVAAIVAPIATSCGSNSMFDGYNLWIPKIAKAVWDHGKFPNGYSEDEALNLYLTDVKNNQDVFVEDMYLLLSVDFLSERDWDEQHNRNFRGSANVQYENIIANPTDLTLSFKVSGFVYMHVADAPLINLKNFSFDVKNIPYKAEKEGYRFGWSVNYNEVKLFESETASINATIDGHFFDDGYLYNFSNESFIFDKEHSYEKLTHGEQVAINLMFETFGGGYNTYHMQDIQHYIDPGK